MEPIPSGYRGGFSFANEENSAKSSDQAYNPWPSGLKKTCRSIDHPDVKHLVS